MPKGIYQRTKTLVISKQLNYQRKHKQLGLCRNCSNPVFNPVTTVYCEYHRKVHLVRNKTIYALHKGIIKQESCEVCNDPNTESHHLDYSKHMLIKWLCRKHHKGQHPNHNRNYPRMVDLLKTNLPYLKYNGKRTKTTQALKIHSR